MSEVQTPRAKLQLQAKSQNQKSFSTPTNSGGQTHNKGERKHLDTTQAQQTDAKRLEQHQKKKGKVRGRGDLGGETAGDGEEKVELGASFPAMLREPRKGAMLLTRSGRGRDKMEERWRGKRRRGGGTRQP